MPGPPRVGGDGRGDPVESPAFRAADADVELLLRFARAGHEAGYPTAELEERVLELAARLGVAPMEISATPTLVEMSFGVVPHQRSYTLRVHPTAVELDRIAQLDELVEDVGEGQLGAVQALAALDEHDAYRLERTWPVIVAAYAVAGVALTPILGGGLREAGAAAVAGLVVGVIALATERASRTEPMVAPLAAIGASFTAAVLARLGLDVNPDVVTLAALVTFLPGMRLTIGMRELATDHLQSGVANTASALVQLFGLVFGVGIGRSIATSWFGPVEASPPQAPVFAIQLLAAVAAGLVFTLTLRARYRDAFLMCGATVLALGANEVGAALFGNQAAVFVAALTVGVVGGLLGSFARRSPLVFIVPGVLMLVPGSAGFNSVLQLLADQTVSGLTAGFDTFVTAMSIAYGLIVSAALVTGRRRARPAPGRAA